MVLISECFPTHKELLLSYFEKFKKGELQAEHAIEESSSFRYGINSTKSENSINEDDEDYLNQIEIESNSNKDEKPKNKKQKKIHYLKNFNKFINRTNRHLDQIIENQKKIDFVHEIVEKIREPLNETEQNRIAEIIGDAKLRNFDDESSEAESDAESVNEVEMNEETLDQNLNQNNSSRNNNNCSTKDNSSSKISIQNSSTSNTSTPRSMQNRLLEMANKTNFFPEFNNRQCRSQRQNTVSTDNTTAGYKSYRSLSSRYKKSVISNPIAEISGEAKIYTLSSKSDKTLSSSLKESIYKPIETAKVEVSFEFENNKNTIKSSSVKSFSFNNTNINNGQRLYSKTLINSRIQNKSARVTPTTYLNKIVENNIIRKSQSARPAPPIYNSKSLTTTLQKPEKKLHLNETTTSKTHINIDFSNRSKKMFRTPLITSNQRRTNILHRTNIYSGLDKNNQMSQFSLFSNLNGRNSTNIEPSLSWQHNLYKMF